MKKVPALVLKPASRRLYPVTIERLSTPGIFASMASTRSATACVRSRLAESGMMIAANP